MQPELKVHINHYGIRISIFGTQKIPGKDGKGKMEPTAEIFKGNIFFIHIFFRQRILYESGITASNIKNQRYDLS